MRSPATTPRKAHRHQLGRPRNHRPASPALGRSVIALYGVGCLLACAIIALSGVVAAWLAALIVGAALLAAAAAAALVGKGGLQKATPPVPEETVGSIKTDVEEIKERARR
jgi:hypothetical protein